jgi:hypothetical protein
VTFVSIRERRSTPVTPQPGLGHSDLILAARRLALDLDADGRGAAAFMAAMGPRLGRSSHQALGALVMVLCGHGRRPFVVGHPRSPLATVAERHLMALIAATQAGADHEVEVRLATLLPAPWREAAEANLHVLALGLARAGLTFAAPAPVTPHRCSGWAGTAANALPSPQPEECQP